MAFCPYCGNSVTDQAEKCTGCGKELQPKSKSARFKGTMLMNPAAAPPAAPPPGGPPAAPPPGDAPAPPGHASQPAPQAATSSSSPAPKRALKPTMLGTGGPALPTGGLAAPPAAGGGAVPAAPPAAGAAPAVGSAPAPDAGLADTAPQPGKPTPAPAAAGDDEDDSKRFLVGDPMAPRPEARSTPRRGYSPVTPERGDSSTGLVVAVAIGGMLAIAAAGYFAASFMGLLN